MSEEQNPPPLPELSLLIFRLADEWFAIDTYALNEVIEKRPIHTIPNRPEKILLGLVNIRGQLKICVSLHILLELPDLQQEKEKYVVISKDNSIWVCPIDELLGIHYFETDQISPKHEAASKTSEAYLKGVIQLGDRNIGYLDAGMLLESLDRSFG